MIQSLHTCLQSNYLKKNSCVIGFGNDSKSNDVAFRKNSQHLNKTKHPAKQALLLTLALLAAQNVAVNNNLMTNSSLTSNVDYAIANAETDEMSINDINIDGVSFNTDKDSLSNEGFNVVAHRGYTVAAPENTIPAYIEAAKHGYSKVECDIAWTKDSIPVLLHDETINRTARYDNGWTPLWPKECSDLTYSQLLKFDFGSWKSDEYKGTNIPTLSNFLQCCKDYNLEPYIELKETSGFDSKKAKILIDSVKNAGLEDSVTWISFNPEYLNLINEQMPNCRLGYLTKDFSSNKTMSVLQNLKTDANEVFLDIKAKAVTENMSNQLADSGFKFEAWTVDNPDELNNLYTKNCNGITTDLLSVHNINETLNFDAND